MGKFYPLESETAIAKRASHCWELLYSDLTAAGNTQTIPGPTFDQYTGIEVVDLELPTPFVSSDVALISTAVTIGDAGSNNRLMTSTELNAAGTYIGVKGPALANTAQPYQYTASTVLNAYVTGTAAKLLSTHTAGRAFIYFNVTQRTPDNGVIPASYPSL
jgi:hypothetical protein